MDITGFDKYVVKHSLVLDEYDNHSLCIVDLIVDNSELQDFMQEFPVGKREIYVSLNEEFVFCGTVKKITCANTYLQTNVRVEAASFTEALDSEPHNRVFQNPLKTYGQINEFLAAEKVRLECLEPGFSGKKTEEILIQRNETDYAFLKRIYGKAGLHLLVNNKKRTTTVLEVGKEKESNLKKLENKDIKRCESCFVVNHEEITVTTNQLYEVGTRVEVFGTSYLVIQRKIESAYDWTEMTYRMVNSPEEPEYVPSESFGLGPARVTGNEDPEHMGRIQVEFLAYENPMAEEKLWLTYLSPLTEKEGGMVFLPDVGELVEVVFRNGECVVTGCIREEKLNETVQNVKKRMIYCRNCSVCIDEKDINIEVGKNKCNLTEQMIELSNEQFEIIITDSQCKIGFADSRLVLEKNAVQLIGNSKLEMKAKEIVADGNSSVKVKTSSFDVG